MLESRHDDAACRAGHTLHIAQHKWGGDAVGLAGASPCDYNGGVRADELRKALGLVKVNFLVGHWVYIKAQIVNIYDMSALFYIGIVMVFLSFIPWLLLSSKMMRDKKEYEQLPLK